VQEFKVQSSKVRVQIKFKAQSPKPLGRSARGSMAQESVRHSRLIVDSFELGHLFGLWTLDFDIECRQSMSATLLQRNNVY
jgi:hypothetical protein